jgi:hypothetical protein
MMRTVGTRATLPVSAPPSHPCDAAQVRGQRRAIGDVSLKAGLELLRVGAIVVLLFVIARAAYFPLWAAQADADELARSWGGPNPLGATVAHWLVAALVGSICAAVVVLTTRLLRRVATGRPEQSV